MNGYRSIFMDFIREMFVWINEDKIGINLRNVWIKTDS